MGSYLVHKIAFQKQKPTMNIIYPSCPPTITQALSSDVTPEILSASGLDGAKFDVGQPHQVYYISPNSLVHEGSLTSARAVAWRNVQYAFGGSVAKEVDTALDATNTQVTSVNQGPYSSVPSEQIEALKKREQDGDENFEIRILRIPEVYLVALWLHSFKSDIIIPVAPTPPNFVAGRDYTPAQLGESLSSVASSLSQQPSDADN
jgi:hypothetical protein